MSLMGHELVQPGCDVVVPDFSCRFLQGEGLFGLEHGARVHAWLLLQNW